jgi:N utilization substance protein A
MPAVQRSEFALALNQVANERGVDVSVVLETVKNAILAAYKKDHPGIEITDYSTTLDQNTGEARIFYNEKDVTPPGFGRIAAQTARQVILQKIREKEKEAIFADYRLRIGTIVNGRVLRFMGPNVIVDIGKTESIMLNSDQIPNERYHLNQRLTVYIVEIRQGLRGEEIIVSRSHTGLLHGLFGREVPEVRMGNVVIKDVARESGTRSKVAVYSNQKGIDPVGSCVGQKGVRIQAIIQEFGNLEKIDIIQWQEDPRLYIVEALSPAKNVKIKKIEEEEKVALVLVPKEELSLAIGKDGQNVRLASKLTGYRIEIEAEEKEEAPQIEKEQTKKIETKAASDAAKEDETTSEAQTVDQPKVKSLRKTNKRKSKKKEENKK